MRADQRSGFSPDTMRKDEVLQVSTRHVCFMSRRRSPVERNPLSRDLSGHHARGGCLRWLKWHRQRDGQAKSVGRWKNLRLLYGLGG